MIQKRRLVAAKRLSASFDKGGLQIQLPEETAEGLRLNLLQKYFRKINNNQTTIFSRIIFQILQGAGRPDLLEHVNNMGPQEWHKTSLRIRNTNSMLSEAFRSMAKLLMKLEESQEDWHHAPIWGTPACTSSFLSTLLTLLHCRPCESTLSPKYLKLISVEASTKMYHQIS